jgi:hypothetical protein
MSLDGLLDVTMIEHEICCARRQEHMQHRGASSRDFFRETYLPYSGRAIHSTKPTRHATIQNTQHNIKKAAHGLACEADWDYLAYSEPEARLFLSRIISDFVVVFMS